MAIRFVIKQNGSNAPTANDQSIAEFVFADEDLFTIGSDAANNLVLAESAPEQAVVVREGEFLTLINRAEGTALNEQSLRREAFQPLAHGDRIEIGNYLIFVVDDQIETPEALPESISLPEDAENNEDFFALPLAETVEEDAAKDLTAETEETAPGFMTTGRNFAEILDTLRTEEDSFYFIVKNEALAEIRRIRLEQAEIPLGINKRREVVSGIEEISTVFAVVRKDWSGILLEPQNRSAVFVNGEKVTGARRLRNDDLVSFSAPVRQSLVLHEPSSLVALESLLTARDTADARFGIHKTSGAALETQIEAAKPKTRTSLFERTFFGYFSFLEVVTMFIATLAVAVLVFLFLEFMFS